MVRYVTVWEASRTIGRTGQKKLVKALARKAGIELVSMGRITGMRPEDIPQLKLELRRYEQRPSIMTASEYFAGAMPSPD